MRTVKQILDLWLEAKKNEDPRKAVQREIRDLHNGDVALPLPEMDRNEKSAIINLFQQGSDAYGQRGSSVLPDPWFAPQKTGFEKWEKLAREQRQVSLGWWKHNRIKRQLGRRFRWYFAYGLAPVRLRYDTKKGMPVWLPSDPLATYAAKTADPDDICPEWTMNAFLQSYAWLQENYPDAYTRLKKPKEFKPSDRVQIVEYNDAEQTTLICVGAAPTWEESIWDSQAKEAQAELLDMIPNRTDLCLAVIPGRITLDRPMGQFDSMVGPYWNAAMLTAMEGIAVKKGIWTNEWLIARANETPKILVQADGVSGVTGVVTGGDLKEVTTNPSFMVNPTIDRFMEAARSTGGVTGDMSGISSSGIRTARRAGQLNGEVVDFPLQEAQEAFGESGEEELKRAIRLDKAIDGSAAKTIYVSWKGARGRIDYVPTDLWTTDCCTVSYAFAGADTNGLVIEGGQRVAMETMSHRSFMEIDPLIADAEIEQDRITVEKLNTAFISSIQTQAADPAGPYQPADFARLVELVGTDKLELPAAVMKVHEEMQKRQAAQPAPPPDGMLADPNAMPGLAAPPPDAAAAMPPPGPSMQNFDQLLGSLTGGRRA